MLATGLGDGNEPRLGAGIFAQTLRLLRHQWRRSRRQRGAAHQEQPRPARVRVGVHVSAL